MSMADRIVKKLRENRLLKERENYNSKSRDDLIQMAQDGDLYAGEVLIKNHQDFIGRMSSKYFLGSGDRDDVMQIATIAFWDAVLKWDGKGDFEAFAGMLIKRKLTDEIRKEDTDRSRVNNLSQSMSDIVADDGDGGTTSIGDVIPSGDPTPAEEYVDQESVEELMKFMRDKFSQAERDVVMRYIKGQKVSEISKETGMKYKSVENALMRVKNKLADYLRTRESKKIREENEGPVNFTDEEKQILSDVINKVDEQVAIEEATASSNSKGD